MSGGGGGSIQAMINSLRDNKNLIRKRPSFAERRKEYLTSYSQLKISSKKATKEELMKVKRKIILQRKVARRKSIIVLSVVIPLIVIAIFYITDTNSSSINRTTTINNQKQIKKYNFHIADGDKMIHKKQWNNAIFQYTRAMEVFPKELDAQYRLALAYSYKCKYENESCNTADSLVNRLYNFYPNNKEIKELKEILILKEESLQ